MTVFGMTSTGPWGAFLTAFALSASLILAIGAQNAFVLRQGIRREHVLAVVLICAFSDAILIAIGVGGFSAIVRSAPWLEPAFTYGGAAFLVWYGFRSLRDAWKGGSTLVPSQDKLTPLRDAVLTCLALTWLNPHVYIDTVVLVGSVSAQFQSPFAFAAGATLASFLFFFALGYGARLLAGLFARPRSWQVLDALVGFTMLAIAIKLLIA